MASPEWILEKRADDQPLVEGRGRRFCSASSLEAWCVDRLIDIVLLRALDFGPARPASARHLPV